MTAKLLEVSCYIQARTTVQLVQGPSLAFDCVAFVQRNYRVRAIVRSDEKAKKLFGESLPRGLQASFAGIPIPVISQSSS